MKKCMHIWKRTRKALGIECHGLSFQCGWHIPCALVELISSQARLLRLLNQEEIEKGGN